MRTAKSLVNAITVSVRNYILFKCIQLKYIKITYGFVAESSTTFRGKHVKF
jgi:hypothetical protein